MTKGLFTAGGSTITWGQTQNIALPTARSPYSQTFSFCSDNSPAHTLHACFKLTTQCLKKIFFWNIHVSKKQRKKKKTLNQFDINSNHYSFVLPREDETRRDCNEEQNFQWNWWCNKLHLLTLLNRCLSASHLSCLLKHSPHAELRGYSMNAL